MKSKISFETNLGLAHEHVKLEILGKLGYLLWDDLLIVRDNVRVMAKKTLTEKKQSGAWGDKKETTGVQHP